MIRSAIIAIAFMTLTIILVVLQPGSRSDDDADTAVVTRGNADLNAITATPGERPAPIAVIPAPLAAAPLPALKPVIKTDNSNVNTMTSGVLAELGLKVAAPAPQNEEMLNMTSGILSNIRAVTGHASTPMEPAKASALQSIVAQALREGQSDTYIDALLNEAAGKGAITVPKALVTSDGRVDTAALLANIVSQAQQASGQAAPEVNPAGGEGVEVRVVQKADGETVQYKFYTVNPGDSLGAIAVKFYGDVTHYAAIFEANRAFLSSPDKIRAGQRLVIPTI